MPRTRVAAPTTQTTRRRLFVIALTFLLSFGVIGVKLIWMQTNSGAQYNQAGVLQRARVLTLEATRGRILDRNGAQLALTVPAPTIIANPKLMTDPEGAAAQIAPIVGVSASTLAERFSDTKVVFCLRGPPGGRWGCRTSEGTP